jgi:hypothetical protein
MRTLNEILVEMKALVEELETHIGKPKTEVKESDLYFASLDSVGDTFVLAGAMDDNMAFTYGGAQPTLHVDDNISLSEINISAR